MVLHDNSSTEQHFTKMMRHFSTRVIQAVVQSRMGDDFKVCQPSVVRNDSSVWFNLVVDEIGEVAAHLKQKMEKYSPLTHPLYLEFTLHTADGNYLPLEFWGIWVDKTYIDENADVHAIVYAQLNTLLKSVIMAARFTPTYRYYVSKQRLDTYVILYRVFIGDPDFSILGEERKFRQIGTLPTPYGAIRMDLHYRTNMVILPTPLNVETAFSQTPLREDDSALSHHTTDEYGNVVPTKGSSIVATSPVLEDFNCFSTSPLSQDFPFVDIDEDSEKACFKLDQSLSTATDLSDARTCRHLSGGSLQSDANSPKASYSFPQRTKQLRIRNNSFPFASLLLLDSHSSSDQSKSQILPKVPEDAVVSGVLHTSSSEQALVGKNRSLSQKKRHFSLTCESAPILSEQFENTENIEQSVLQKSKGENSCEDKDFQTKKKVVFGCSSVEENDGDSKKETENTDNSNQKERISKEDDEEDDRHSCSSDDSYVKVIAFASSDNLYSDLTDFAQDMHLAPKNLASCLAESANEITKQIDDFRERAPVFDNFVAGLKELDEGENSKW